MGWHTLFTANELAIRQYLIPSWPSRDLNTPDALGRALIAVHCMSPMHRTTSIPFYSTEDVLVSPGTYHGYNSHVILIFTGRRLQEMQDVSSSDLKALIKVDRLCVEQEDIVDLAASEASPAGQRSDRTPNSDAPLYGIYSLSEDGTADYCSEPEVKWNAMQLGFAFSKLVHGDGRWADVRYVHPGLVKEYAILRPCVAVFAYSRAHLRRLSSLTDQELYEFNKVRMQSR